MNHKKPLDGIRVIDFTRVLAGPYCTQLLGDIGAEVVKIEEPVSGDSLRHQGPPFVHETGITFYAANRNKKSITLDLKSKSGNALARELISKADVLVENFRPGVMDKFGFGYSQIKDANPRLIYASISGYGADGPDSAKRAYDLTAQAVGGYMSITGERNGRPVKLGTSGFDIVTGTNCFAGVLAALFQRSVTGRGQRVETSLLESQVAFLVNAALEYLLTGVEPQKWGSEHAQQVPYKAFKTADGWAVIGAGVQHFYEKLCTILKRDDLITDERFSTLEKRVVNRDELYAILDDEVGKTKTRDILSALEAEGVPCAPIRNMEQVFSDPQILHREMLQKITHPAYGKVSLIGSAVKYSDFKVTDKWIAPPTVGQDTEQILTSWLGLNKDDIAKLSSEGAL